MNREVFMEQPAISGTNYGLQEYWLIIHPDVDVHRKIKLEKQQFVEDYGVQHVLGSNPHIVVAQFMAREGMEDTLIRWLQRIFSRQHSFPVTLNNYSGLPTHSICLRIQDHAPFVELAQQLQSIDEFIRSSGCPPALLFRKPYLNIAARLPEAVFAKAMQEYSRRSFHETFMAKELLLLKRSFFSDACKNIHVFRFLPAEQ